MYVWFYVAKNNARNTIVADATIFFLRSTMCACASERLVILTKTDLADFLRHDEINRNAWDKLSYPVSISCVQS
jgi:hypothetical protein